MRDMENVSVGQRVQVNMPGSLYDGLRGRVDSITGLNGIGVKLDDGLGAYLFGLHELAREPGLTVQRQPLLSRSDAQRVQEAKTILKAFREGTLSQSDVILRLEEALA